MTQKNMVEKKQLRPPYASSGIADAILDLFRRIVPRKIDNKFIVENDIATQNNAFTATDLVKWLGITDDDGNVNDEVMSKLKLVGDAREKFIKGLVESSYAELMKEVNLKEAKKEDVVNYFVRNYKFGQAQAKYAAALFLHLCFRYQISVSDELTKKTHTGAGKPKVKKENNNQKRAEKKTSAPEGHLIPNNGKTANDGEVLIEIKGPRGLYFPLVAKSKEELDKIVNTQIKPIIEAVILTLPDNHVNKAGEKIEPD